MNIKNMSEADLLKEYTFEVKKLEELGVGVELALTPHQALSLIGAVQLALRHPGFTGPTSKIARAIVETIESGFSVADVPHVLEVIRRGWVREYDQE